MLVKAGLVEALQLLSCAYGIQNRTFPFFEPHTLSQGIGNYQDVREYDRGIKPEPPDGLERHFGREIRSAAEQ